MAGLDLFAELTALANALEAAALPYALCGGLAVGVHGAPRATKDVDLLVAPEDLVAVKEVARALGFVLEALPMRFKSSGVEMHRLSKIVEGHLLSLDLLIADEALRPVFEDRQQLTYEGGRIWVVSRRGLVSMKVAAGRSQDVYDLERLQEEQ
jgi:hypothetical protein